MKMGDGAIIGIAALGAYLVGQLLVLLVSRSKRILRRPGKC